LKAGAEGEVVGAVEVVAAVVHVPSAARWVKSAVNAIRKAIAFCASLITRRVRDAAVARGDAAAGCGVEEYEALAPQGNRILLREDL
jgi:hypothetical protein